MRVKSLMDIFRVLNEFLIKAGQIILKPDRKPSPGGFAIAVLLGIIAVYAWQIGVIKTTDPAGIREKALFGTCGIYYDEDHAFTYGIYYWGRFPLFPERQALPDRFLQDDLYFSRAGAQEILDNFKDALRMDAGGTLRSGNRLNLWIPYVDALIKHTPKGANYVAFNRMFFITSLAMVFFSFALQGRWILGSLIVLLVGSYPFQIYMAHFNDNIFSYQISNIMLLLAIFSPFVLGMRLTGNKALLIASAAGIMAGVSYLLRADCLSGVVACAAVIIMLNDTRFGKKLLITAVLCASFMIFTNVVQVALTNKISETFQFAKDSGIEVLDTQGLKSHALWYTIWCGMSDFDTKYYKVRTDWTGNVRAKGVLEKDFGVDVGRVPYCNKPQNDYFMAVKFPQFDAAMRKAVLGEIANDPLWLLSILAKRFYMILGKTIPLEVNLILFKLRVSCHFIFYSSLLAFLLVYFKNMRMLIVFSSATALVPFVITTTCNYNHYSIVHLIAWAVLFYSGVKIMLHYRFSASGASELR